MNARTIVGSAPGKLFIAGEYAVVTPGEPAVIIAVDRMLEVTVADASTPGAVKSDLFRGAPDRTYVRDEAGTLSFVPSDSLEYVEEAIRIVEDLVRARNLTLRDFSIHITSELAEASTDGVAGRKYGLGSSGAVTVATVDAMNRFYELHLTRLERFKLAYLATMQVSASGSGGDLAASTYRGWIAYRSPERRAVSEIYRAEGVQAVLAAEWPGLAVEPLPAPASLRLLVAWSATPAHTDTLVRGVLSRLSTEQHETFLAESRAAVEALITGIQDDDSAALKSAVTRARGVLRRLSALTGGHIETDTLQYACDVAEAHRGAAKTSGAGGGDCAIVLLDHDVSDSKLVEAWQARGIEQLPLSVEPPEGASVA